MEWEMGEKEPQLNAYILQIQFWFQIWNDNSGQDNYPKLFREIKLTQEIISKNQRAYFRILVSTSVIKTEMGLQKMNNQDTDLVVSTDAKPRLKWTPVLHQRFIEAVTQLGGPDKATPKSLMRVMGIPGLTLYHLKSHLQKYRLGKSQESEPCNDNEQEGSLNIDYIENEIEGGHISGMILDRTNMQINESLQIAQTLQMQMEVQNKLHEQIEVQRHLQLRIEAQGKYLQSILKKAQETLAGYDSTTTGIEAAKTEVSELVSMVETGYLSSSLTGSFVLNNVGNRSMRVTDCSIDSSLTSSESSGRKNEKQPLIAINPSQSNLYNTGSSFKLAGRKRSGSTISDESCVEQPLIKISQPQQEKHFKQLKLGLSVELDLNCEYQNELGSTRQELDLNCAETELFDESLKQFGA